MGIKIIKRFWREKKSERPLKGKTNFSVIFVFSENVFQRIVQNLCEFLYIVPKKTGWMKILGKELTEIYKMFIIRKDKGE